MSYGIALKIATEAHKGQKRWNGDDNIIPTININHNCTHNIYVEYNYDDFIIKGSD